LIKRVEEVFAGAVQADDAGAGAEGFQIFRQEFFPQFFAETEQQNRRRGGGDVALKPQVIRHPSAPGCPFQVALTHSYGSIQKNEVCRSLFRRLTALTEFTAEYLIAGALRALWSKTRFYKGREYELY